MLRASISFFVIGLVAMALGAYHVGGLSVDIGKTLLYLFLGLSLLTFLMSIMSGKSTRLY
jgi:uncharacterized membrane protein YtjA (UPF0391 family)